MMNLTSCGVVFHMRVTIVGLFKAGHGYSAMKTHTLLRPLKTYERYVYRIK